MKNQACKTLVVASALFLLAGVASAQCGPVGPACQLGTNGNDFIFLGTGNDCIHLLAGNDVAFGNDGRDFIVGGDGVDIVYGERGRDCLRLEGDPGVVDHGYGGNGDDQLVGDLGDDLNGDAGNDTCLFGNLGTFC